MLVLFTAVATIAVVRFFPQLIGFLSSRAVRH